MSGEATTAPAKKPRTAKSILKQMQARRAQVAAEVVGSAQRWEESALNRESAEFEDACLDLVVAVRRLRDLDALLTPPA